MRLMGPKLQNCVLLTGVILTTLLVSGKCYKHIVFMHGIFSGPEEFNYFSDLVQQLHPGTPVTNINAFNSLSSLQDMWTQVNNISTIVRPILTNTSSEGSILICYSQGGLICRALLATIAHNVKTFIALSSPLAGQYGDTDYLKRILPNYLKKNLYKVLYTKGGQKYSVGNYWNDPHQQALFRQFSTFLATLNNESTTVNPKSQEYKKNFLRLKNLVLVGGPDDGVIEPWQSSQFGYYNTSEIVLPMEQQEWYRKDTFGLKTLNSRGGLHVHTVPGVKHIQWYGNKSVFEECIKPWL